MFLAALLFGLWVFLQNSSESGAGNPERSGNPRTEETVSSTQIAETSLGANSSEEEQASVHRETANSAHDVVSNQKPEGIPLLLLHEMGGPVVGATVIPWLGEELGETVVTNEKGEATLHTQLGLGGLAIYAKNRAPFRMTFDFSGDAIVVILEQGYRLAGKVTFTHGRKREAPVFLSSVSGHPYAKEIPIPIQRALRSKEFGSNISQWEINTDGRFECIGLPFDWTGTLEISTGYLFCRCSSPGKINNDGNLKLSQLTENLEISVTELPTFYGRIVTPDGQMGVPNVDLMGVATFNPKRVNGVLFDAKSKANGNFEIPVWVGSQKERELWCKHPEEMKAYDIQLGTGGTEKWGQVHLEIDLEKVEDPWNLGDIALSNRNKLSYRVMDERGQPLEGALSYASTLSEDTDKDGFGEAEFEPEVKTITFGAKGYSSSEFLIAEIEEEVLQVKLEKASSVLLRWVVPEGANMTGIKIELKGEQGIFEQDGMGFGADWRFRRAFGIQTKGGRGRGGIFQSTGWELDEDQRELEVWGVRPNVPLTFCLSDLMASVLDQEELVLAPGEHRELNFEITVPPKSFEGVVTDESGNALDRVQLKLNAYNYGIGRSTNRQGEFDFQGIGSLTVNLSASKDGYAVFHDAEFPVPPAGLPARISLEKARQLVVYLQTPSGIILRNSFYERVHGSLGSQEETEDDGTLLAEAPEREFLLRWSLGGVKEEVSVPAGVQKFFIEVPEMATARLTYQFGPPHEKGHYRTTFVPQGFNLTYDDGMYHSNARRTALGEGEGEIAVLPGTYLVRFMRWDIPSVSWLLVKEIGIVELAAGANPPMTLID